MSVKLKKHVDAVSIASAARGFRDIENSWRKDLREARSESRRQSFYVKAEYYKGKAEALESLLEETPDA